MTYIAPPMMEVFARMDVNRTSRFTGHAAQSHLPPPLPLPVSFSFYLLYVAKLQAGQEAPATSIAVWRLEAMSPAIQEKTLAKLCLSDTQIAPKHQSW